MRSTLAFSTTLCGAAAAVLMAACSSDETAPAPVGDGGPGGAATGTGGRATGGHASGSGGRANGGSPATGGAPTAGAGGGASGTGGNGAASGGGTDGATTGGCTVNSDCASGVCVGSVCASATCTDGVKNGTETDVDCGGASCPKCAVGGQACSVNGDCASNVCGDTGCGEPPAVALPQVLAVTATVAGSTFGEWEAAQWKWLLSIPDTSNPLNDSDGTFCAEGQSGPVWFLAGSSVGSATRSCTIPAGKYIFFPILNYLNDYPCPDPNFKPAPNQSLQDFLTAGARATMDGASTLLFELDGVRLLNPFSYRSTSAMFDFTADASLTFDPCFTYTSQQGVSDGYWIMLEPLPPGPHVLHFAGSANAAGGSISVDVTYQIVVSNADAGTGANTDAAVDSGPG